MVRKSLDKFTQKLVPYRVWIQSAFLLVWLDPLQLRLHGICAPVFHCYACPLSTFACPIGVLAQFTALHLWPLVAIGVLVMFGALFGTLICGWLCPFGFLQDLGAKVPTPKWDPPKWAGYIRYLALLGTVFAVPYFFGKSHPLFICSICPAGALEAAAPNVARQAIAGAEIVWPNAIKVAILAAFLVAIFFMRRPWCRILCPLGAVFSLFNRVSAFFLRFDPEKCTTCNHCHKLCEYDIKPYETPNSLHCVRCLKCTDCRPNALRLGSVFESEEHGQDTSYS